MPALIAGLGELSRKYDLPIINFGHAGNGNIHVNLLLDPDQPEQGKKAHACLDEIFSLVLELNGTLSGEHGVGLEKAGFCRSGTGCEFSGTDAGHQAPIRSERHTQSR